MTRIEELEKEIELMQRLIELQKQWKEMQKDIRIVPYPYPIYPTWPYPWITYAYPTTEGNY